MTEPKVRSFYLDDGVEREGRGDVVYLGKVFRYPGTAMDLNPKERAKLMSGEQPAVLAILGKIVGMGNDVPGPIERFEAFDVDANQFLVIYRIPARTG